MNYDKVPELPDPPAALMTPRRRGVAGIILVVLAVGALAAWWLMRPAAVTMDPKTRAEVTRLEERVPVLAAQLAALPHDAPLSARRPIIEEAVATQTALIKLRRPPAPGDAVQLSEWQQKLDELAAREVGDRSRALAAEADTLLRDRHPAEALAKLKEALRLQRAVNTGLTDRQTKSYGREAELQQRIEELEAQPLADESHAAQAEAQVAAGAGRWADARGLYQRAQEIQRQLMRDFPHTRFADAAVEGRLEAAITALGTDEARVRAGSELREAAAAIAGHLRRREVFQARQLLAATLARLESEPAGADPAVRLPLEFLGKHAAELAEIQDEAYARLGPPLPGGAWAVGQTLVPQGLYLRLMPDNPSRNPGRARPVDSVSYGETLEFCRRLGWVLGRTVRLPAVGERPAPAATDEVTEEWLGTAFPGDIAPQTAGGKEQAVTRTTRSRTVGFRVVVELDAPAAAGK